MAESKLLSTLSGTFEPANVHWLKIQCCGACKATTLRSPRFSANGMMAFMSCPTCNYLNIEKLDQAWVKR